MGIGGKEASGAGTGDTALLSMCLVRTISTAIHTRCSLMLMQSVLVRGTLTNRQRAFGKCAFVSILLLRFQSGPTSSSTSLVFHPPKHSIFGAPFYSAPFPPAVNVSPLTRYYLSFTTDSGPPVRPNMVCVCVWRWGLEDCPFRSSEALALRCSSLRHAQIAEMMRRTERK